MTRQPRPRPPLVPLRALAIVLVVALIGLTSCSDAHSQAQLDLSNPGYDPTTIVILAPKAIGPALLELGAAFTRSHPGVSFVLVSDVVTLMLHNVSRHRTPKLPKNGREQLEANLAPDLWIDAGSAITAMKPPNVKFYGDRKTFGDDQIALIVPLGNPGGVTGLAAFARGSGFKTGLCNDHTPCGSLARLVLRSAHVSPSPTFSTRDGSVLAGEVGRGSLQAALLLSSQAEANANVATVPIRPAPSATIPYQMVQLDQSPIANEFAEWAVTSATATSVLAANGISRPGSS